MLDRRCVMTPMFLVLNGRRLFALQVAPAQAPTGAVLYLPPFNEEMNRCRNHVAHTARELARRGQLVLLLDPFGTGESEGGTAEPDWTHWVADGVAGARWLAHASGGVPITLWGLRTGALLAADVAEALQDLALARLLLWQPVLDGKTFVNQHLRLRIASQLVHAGNGETTESLRARLAAGEDIEVAGYPLSPRMAETLSGRRLSNAALLARQPLDWFEIVARADQKPGLPTQRLLDSVAAAGGQAKLHQVVGEQIWQSNTHKEADRLSAATAELWGDAPAG